jgi:hypothetical protein
MADSKVRPWAPAYRVAVEFMQVGILKLAANGDLTEPEVAHLHKLYIAGGEANRSLDLLEALHCQLPAPENFIEHYHVTRQMRSETSRCRLKFDGVSAAVEPAHAAIIAALSRLEWFEKS